MVEDDLSWFPGEIKYQYFHCYSCKKAIFVVFIHHLYILPDHTTKSISFQKLKGSKTKPWLNIAIAEMINASCSKKYNVQLPNGADDNLSFGM